MRFTNKQVVGMTAMVCATAVLMPVAVGAATGQLVNIADPSIGARQARVTAAGALKVESRAGGGDGAFNVTGSRLGVGWMPLVAAANPQRIAITELTVTGQGPAGPQVFRIEAWIRKGSTGSCNSPNLTEFTKVVYRQVSVPNYETHTMNFAGTPLYVTPAPPAGTYTCLGIVSIQAPSGSEAHVGATGYRFTP